MEIEVHNPVCIITPDHTVMTLFSLSNVKTTQVLFQPAKFIIGAVVGTLILHRHESSHNIRLCWFNMIDSLQLHDLQESNPTCGVKMNGG